MPEASCSFLSISECDLCIVIGSLIAQKWQKWFQFRHISKLQFVLLENYNCEFLCHVLNWRLHTTTGLLHWKFPIFFFIGMNSSISISIENFFFSKTRFFSKINCCMFKPSFLCRLDRKYRSAIAPFVLNSLRIFILCMILDDLFLEFPP